MKIILKVVKKVIFALSIIYGFNLIMTQVGLFIPINIYTISISTIFGFPGLLLLVGLNVLI